MGNPKISIIVPIYNGEKFVQRCLNNITSQTFLDFEAILVDDGSTDRSGAVCEEYAKKAVSYTHLTLPTICSV